MADYSQELIDFLKRTEGYAPTAKWDVRQHSGGYGSRAAPGETFTPEKAEQRLRQELDTVDGYLQQNVTVPLNEGQRSGLLSFGYNLGVDDIGKLLPDINSGNWSRVSQRMLDFNKAKNEKTGQLEPLEGLTTRRHAEASFVNGGFPPNASAPSTSPIWNSPIKDDPNMMNILAALGGSNSLLGGIGKAAGFSGLEKAGGQNSIFGSLASMFGGGEGEEQPGGGGEGEDGADAGGGGGAGGLKLAQDAMAAASTGGEEQMKGVQQKPIDLAMLAKILQQRAGYGSGATASKGLGVG